MELSDFEIGREFVCAGNVFLCTDKGTRVVVAIEAKEDWMAGPPYALAELVFDEDDITVCTLNAEGNRRCAAKGLGK